MKLETRITRTSVILGCPRCGEWIEMSSKVGEKRAPYLTCMMPGCPIDTEDVNEGDRPPPTLQERLAAYKTKKHDARTP
jgi:hypothetical protein